MSVIKTPAQELIAKIREVDKVEVVAFGSNPSRVAGIIDLLPNDFVFGNYSVQNANTTKIQNLPDNSKKSDISIV